MGEKQKLHLTDKKGECNIFPIRCLGGVTMVKKKKIELAKEITITDDACLKIKNELVNGRYTLTLTEIKMIMALAAHIDKDADDFEICAISARDLGAYMGLDEKSMYNQIKTTAKKLLCKNLFFEWYEEGCREKSWQGSPWFTKLSYSAKDGMLRFCFADDIKPMLLQIREAYVQLECKPLMAFKCMYSNRFLMYIVEWIKIQPYKIDIAELRERLQLGKKYETYKDFRRFVIEPALSEINVLTDYNVKAVPQKRGRSYVSYVFHIKRKTNPIDADAVPAEWTDEQNATYNEVIALGLEKDVAKKIIEEKPLNEIKISIDYAKAQKAAGKVKQLGAYLYAAINKGYGIAEAIAAEQEAAAAIAKEQERLAAMTPEQRDENEQRKKWFKDMTNGNSKISKSSEDTQKEAIKREFLEVDRESQERFLTWVQSELDKDSNPVHKSMFEILVRSTIDDVLNDNMILGKLVAYTYMLRYSD